MLQGSHSALLSKLTINKVTTFDNHTYDPKYQYYLFSSGYRDNDHHLAYQGQSNWLTMRQTVYSDVCLVLSKYSSLIVFAVCSFYTLVDLISPRSLNLFRCQRSKTSYFGKGLYGKLKLLLVLQELYQLKIWVWKLTFN